MPLGGPGEHFSDSGGYGNFNQGGGGFQAGGSLNSGNAHPTGDWNQALASIMGGGYGLLSGGYNPATSTGVGAPGNPNAGIARLMQRPPIPIPRSKPPLRRDPITGAIIPGYTGPVPGDEWQGWGITDNPGLEIGYGAYPNWHAMAGEYPGMSGAPGGPFKDWSRMDNGGTSSFGNNPNIGGLFGGARARGGPVAQGQAYTVGERGPETFVPQQPGTIVPNGGQSPVDPRLLIMAALASQKRKISAGAPRKKFRVGGDLRRRHYLAIAKKAAA